MSVIQAAKAMKEQNLHQSASTGSLSGKMMWGRLRKTPKLPAKPPIQSSESSTDDLSGSEDSSSSGLEDAEKEARNKEEESNMPQGKGGFLVKVECNFELISTIFEFSRQKFM